MEKSRAVIKISISKWIAPQASWNCEGCLRRDTRIVFISKYRNTEIGLCRLCCWKLFWKNLFVKQGKRVDTSGNEI